MAKSKKKKRNQQRRRSQPHTRGKTAGDGRHQSASHSVEEAAGTSETGSTFRLLDAPKDYDAALASYGEVGPDESSSRYQTYDGGGVLFICPGEPQPDGTFAEFLVKIELGELLTDGNLEAYLRADGSWLEGDNVPDEWLRYFTPAWWNCTQLVAESRFEGKAVHVVYVVYEGESMTLEEAEWVAEFVRNGTTLSPRQCIETARAVRQ
jgi:hypothetical protein